MSRKESTEVIDSLYSLSLNQVIDKYELSWLQMKDILNQYSFVGYVDYDNNISVRAPYFIDIEKTYIWGYLKACTLASKKLFELVPIRAVHDTLQLPIEAFRDILFGYIQEQIEFCRDDGNDTKSSN
ncbi:hypothetical protein [Aneurinibacillus tyrosinisolvens]|uniref:hypothetical protein n=1 Tax=Aneurinibacillus tyrosinisolvens TaxID=1443435 RepID=UPI00063FC455|nr:hypothetical protein [Aneurinibacillus tyrosinisolvens]